MHAVFSLQLYCLLAQSFTNSWISWRGQTQLSWNGGFAQGGLIPDFFYHVSALAASAFSTQKMLLHRLCQRWLLRLKSWVCTSQVEFWSMICSPATRKTIKSWWNGPSSAPFRVSPRFQSPIWGDLLGTCCPVFHFESIQTSFACGNPSSIPVATLQCINHHRSSISGPDLDSYLTLFKDASEEADQMDEKKWMKEVDEWMTRTFGLPKEELERGTRKQVRGHLQMLLRRHLDLPHDHDCLEIEVDLGALEGQKDSEFFVKVLFGHENSMKASQYPRGSQPSRDQPIKVKVHFPAGVQQCKVLVWRRSFGQKMVEEKVVEELVGITEKIDIRPMPQCFILSILRDRNVCCLFDNWKLPLLPIAFSTLYVCHSKLVLVTSSRWRYMGIAFRDVLGIQETEKPRNKRKWNARTTKTKETFEHSKCRKVEKPKKFQTAARVVKAPSGRISEIFKLKQNQQATLSIWIMYFDSGWICTLFQFSDFLVESFWWFWILFAFAFKTVFLLFRYVWSFWCICIF